MSEISTKKHAPIFEDQEGVLYQKMNQTEAIRMPEAIREIVGEGKEAEVRWLIRIGVVDGSPAAQKMIDDWNLNRAKQLQEQMANAVPVDKKVDAAFDKKADSKQVDPNQTVDQNQTKVEKRNTVAAK